MKRKKKIIALLLVAAMSLSLVACSSDSDKDVDDDVDIEEDEEEDDEEEEEETTEATTVATSTPTPSPTSTPTPSPTSTPTPTPTPTQAPVMNAVGGKSKGAAEYNGHFYAVYDEGVDWETAEAMCEEMGGHLVTITDQNEQFFIQGLIADSESPYYWIGLTDKVIEGDFTWVTGESLIYTNWSVKQPDNWGDIENYVMIPARSVVYTETNWKNDVGEWNDIANEGDREHDLVDMGFICEWDNVDSEVLTKKQQIINEINNGLEAYGVAGHVDSITGELILDSGILFDVNSYELSEEGTLEVCKVALIVESIMNNPEYDGFIETILISGHTDSNGKYEDNVVLSQQRAIYVSYCFMATYEVEENMDSYDKFMSLLWCVGCSSDNPVLDENGVEDKDASRRVSISFLINVC